MIVGAVSFGLGLGGVGVALAAFAELLTSLIVWSARGGKGRSER